MAKILVVEDSATQRSIYKAMLFKKNYLVIEAKNGREGIEKTKKETPDVIISDIVMPEMDGLEMVSILKKDEKMKYIPIICASATFQDLATKMKALMDAGAEEYFYLPQTEEELLLKVAVMLRIRQLYVDLLEKNKQLRLFNEVAVDRELKMKELKEQNFKLQEELKKIRPGK